MKLHEWIYELVCEVCYDREYVYTSYVRHFGQLMKDILEQGKFCQSGNYEIIGMKSNLKVILKWDLERCINFVGLNVVSIIYSIESLDTNKMESRGVRNFELSTGEETIGGSGG